MDPNILGNFQVCISVPLIIAKWRPGLQVRDSMYSEAGPRGTIRVGWLNLQPFKWLFGASASWFLVGRACWAGLAFSWAMHGLGWLFGLILGSSGNCMCARVLLVLLWLRQSMITPNCGISGGPQIFFYFPIQRISLITKNARDNNCYFWYLSAYGVDIILVCVLSVQVKILQKCRDFFHIESGCRGFSHIQNLYDVPKKCLGIIQSFLPTKFWQFGRNCFWKWSFINSFKGANR